MVDFLEEVYSLADTIFDIKKIIKYAYSGYDIDIIRYWDSVSNKIVKTCQYLNNLDSNLANKIMFAIEHACKHTTSTPGNYNLFADELTNTLPLLYEASTLLGEIDSTDNDFQFKSSKSGFLSLKNTRTNKQYNSLIDPMYEAYEHACRIYSPSFISFKIMGCDLGYLPYQLFELSDRSMNLYIYHTSKEAIQYAYDFGVLSWIPENKLHIIINSNIQSLFASYIDAEEISFGGAIGYHLDKDFIESAPDALQTGMKHFNILNETRTILEKNKLINSYRNIYNVTDLICNFNPMANDTWAVVAGGPSLDNQLEYLLSNQNNINIICVSTVLKKLLQLGISPCAVIVSDPQARTSKHFEDLPSSTTPLLISNLASWQIAEKYSGPKYLIPCMTDTNINNFFNSQGLEPYNAGSTISVLAIEIAASYNPQKILLFGLDLSYPGGKSHASGTMDYHDTANKNTIYIKNVKGEDVKTVEQFKIYLSQVEATIFSHPNIEFINHTDSGANIRGTKWYK